MEKLHVVPQVSCLGKGGRGEVKIVNEGNESYAFKVKTTDPALYTVKPSVGILPGKSALVLKVQRLKELGEKGDPGSNKFLFRFTPCNKRMKAEELRELFNLKGIEVIDRKVDVRMEEEKMYRQMEGSFILSIATVAIAYNLLVLLKNMVLG
jgi:MSP (Major sperm protein) domain